ncbi:MAG TPA: glycosyltransferase [Candidatus Eisenbacteria bacterium]|nr:glycosyltransferase [Candidatus Eisenbacteria bacterium]
MRVSVVLAAYNAAWCIERGLESALAQSEPPLEVIVCDDGSTDGTPEVIERRFGDRITVLRLPHRNASDTRRVGIERARGDWIAFMDADDLWHPDKLARQRAWHERHPEVRFFGSDGRLVSEAGVVRASWLSGYFDPPHELVGDLLPALATRCFLLMSSMLVSREAYDAVGGLDPAIVYSHDYDLWLRLASRFPGGLMTDVLVDYYSGPGTLSRAFEARTRDDCALMRRLAAGSPSAPPSVRRGARERAAALSFDLAIAAWRGGREHEARGLLRCAADAGPPGRRTLAAGAALLPGWAARRLMRSDWVKQSVLHVRHDPARVVLNAGEGVAP